MSRFIFERWSKYILPLRWSIWCWTDVAQSPTKSCSFHSPVSVMKRTVTPRGRVILAYTPGRQGLASSWSFILTEACRTSGLAMRMTRPRSSEASTTASRCISPSWTAARPTPGIASITSTISSQIARTVSVISGTVSAGVFSRLSGHCSTGRGMAHAFSRARSFLSLTILRVIIWRFSGFR